MEENKWFGLRGGEEKDKSGGGKDEMEKRGIGGEERRKIKGEAERPG